MSPLNKQQLEIIRDERATQIKQASLKVFARYGYSGTKTSMIASEAGISEGLIYRYFSSKEELFNTLIQELLEDASRELENLHQLQGSPYEQIKAVTENMLDEANRNAFILIQTTRMDEDIPQKATENLKKYSADTLIDLLLPIFVKGQESGEFYEEDPCRLASWYFSIVNSICMQEWGKEEYGMPSVEVLMRILKKN
ncbi:MAG: TetR/AcrR family transcriptional regulator [Clostridia bacterium]|nr:TetR/AcrR family transcriptional regulator [Clostridia bacterium]